MQTKQRPGREKLDNSKLYLLIDVRGGY